MHIGLLTREWPPEVYGGAGVHVEYLVPRLRELVGVDVHCFGAPRSTEGVHSHNPAQGLEGANQALRTLSADLSITAAVDGVDLVHSHTWYANLAGHLAKILYGVPHVITAHSLEPRRPWKAEQLGGGYRLSSWVEKTAYEAADAIIAVSSGMREDVLDCYPALDPERVQVVRNGIDSSAYHPVTEDDALHHYGVDPDAADRRVRRADHPAEGRRPPDRRGAPDRSRGAARAVRGRAGHAGDRRGDRGRGGRVRERTAGVIWIQKMLQPAEVRQLLSHATVFVCPSVYEPLGIVNLEAMACGDRGRRLGRRGIPRSSTTARPACWCTTTRATRRPSATASRTP